MRVRSSRFFLLTMSLLLASPAGVAAQGVGHGGIGQEGAQVPAPGVPEVALGSRFTPLQGPTGIPMLGLRVGAWSGGSLGLRYSSSGAYLGNPHELEFSVKQRLLSEERGAPVSASFLGAVNTGAYSLDGELALSRDLGPVTLLGTARLLGNADGARLPLGGFGAGARLGLLPQLALVGDVFQVVNEAGALPAWGAGVQVQLPASPYAVTLHVANAPSPTRQGASLGTSDLRFGIDMAMVFPGWSTHRAAAPVKAPEQPHGEGWSGHEVKPVPSAPVRVMEAPVAPAASNPSAPNPSSAAKPEPVPAHGKPNSVKQALRPAPRLEAPIRAAHAAPAVQPKPQATSKPQAKSKPASPSTARSKARSASKAVPKAAAIAKPQPAAAPKRQLSELWIVMIRSGQPTPAQVRLTRGSSVTWFNRDATEHALVARGWDSGTLSAGAQVTRRFDKAGTFRYRCRLHPQEAGSITVD